MRLPKPLYLGIALGLLFDSFVVGAVSQSAPTRTNATTKTTGAKTTAPLPPLQLSAPKTIQAPTVVQEGMVRARIVTPHSGRLAYGFTLLEGLGQTYLALHTLNSQDKPTSTHLYSLYLGQRQNRYYKLNQIFNPQFSPDGQRVLLRFGSPDFSINGFLLYVLDLENGKLIPVSSRIIRYHQTSWSPDGNYIAYMENGDAQGGINVGPDNWYLGPLTLWVCNWRTGKELKVMENDTLRGPFNWNGAHNLVYGFLPPGSKVDAGDQPNVYEFSVEKEASRLVFKDGYRPVPSPDGKKVVFWGSNEPQKPSRLQGGWGDAPTGSYLSVANLDGTQRVALDQTRRYGEVVWLPDSEGFLTLEQTQGDLHLEAQIRQWKVAGTSFRSVTTLQAQGTKHHGLPLFDPDFHILSLSKDGKKLFVSATSYAARADTKLSVDEVVSVYAIDIQSGEKTVICQVDNAEGLDWHAVSQTK